MIPADITFKVYALMIMLLIMAIPIVIIMLTAGFITKVFKRSFTILKK